MTTVANQVKQFRQYCFGGYQWQPELLKRIHRDPVPSIRSVHQRQKRACIDQSVSGHSAAADADARLAVHSPAGEHCRSREPQSTSLRPSEGEVALHCPLCPQTIEKERLKAS